MNRDSRIFVAGSQTLLGAALQQHLCEQGFDNLVGIGTDEPDLTNSTEVDAFFTAVRPEFVFLAGGKSGGIGLNRERPADLMLDNLRIITNVLDASHRFDVAKLLYLGSSCMYPKHAPQPLRVESLGTGPMEPTSEAYSTAKLAGWKLCNAYRRQFGSRFITGIPANAFGPHDDFNANSGHVVPALIHRMHDAKQRGDAALSIWGTGTPRREFIYVRDLADACVFAMEHFEGEAPLNLGCGTDLSIADVARTIADVVGFTGHLLFDTTKPDGAPRKGLDSSELRALGWLSETNFPTAIEETYTWFLHHCVTEDAHAIAVV